MSQDEIDVAARVQAMRDEEVVDFIRDTVSRLNALADRLERIADQEDSDARGNSDAAASGGSRSDSRPVGAAESRLPDPPRG